MTYLFWKSDGTVEDIVSEKPLSLEKLQELVEGYIEGLALPNGHYLMFNEEGYLKDLPVNPKWNADHPQLERISTLGGLRGNVIEGLTDDEGEFIGF